MQVTALFRFPADRHHITMNENQTVENNALFHLLTVCGNKAASGCSLVSRVAWRGPSQPQLPGAVVLSNASGGGGHGGSGEGQSEQVDTGEKMMLAI